MHREHNGRQNGLDFIHNSPHRIESTWLQPMSLATVGGLGGSIRQFHQVMNGYDIVVRLVFFSPSTVC